jgi:RHS repeat-associated protein
MAIGFDTVSGGGLKPRFAVSDIAAEPAPARTTLPGTATAALHLEDAATNVAVDVSLMGASAAAAQQADGDLVYPGVLPSGGTIVHRPLPAGTEDFFAFDAKPSTTQMAYSLKLGAGAAGLRLVGGTLEVLDVGGTPRLHVAPPYVVGADGVSTDATLAVSGCAVDVDPSPPWGRAVTAPGASTCQVTVTWPSTGISYPAIVDPRWTTTGSMGTARQEHTALLLATGKVLVAGGRSSNSGTTGLTTAELYDKTTGTWATTGSMTGGRRLHSMTQLNTSSNSTTSGKVLVAGGINSSTSLSTAELYNATAGTWAAAGNLNAARHLQTANLLPDGKVLVCGGMNGTTTLQTAAVYNPASGSGSWSATTGPIPPPGWRFGTATLIQTTNTQLNNKVLLVGGNSGTSSLSSVFLFDPVQSAFSTLASISSPREQHTAVVLPSTNGKILVTGGKNGSTTLATALIFDPSSSNGTWSSAGTMTSARFGHSATVLPQSIVANGSVLVAGGNNGSGALTSAELFSGTSTWTATPSMPSPPSQGHTATLLGNNMILVAGGLNGSTVLNNARLYDASFGLACTSSSQCTTGNCVNGVCCDTACNTGTCGACNLAGHLGTCTALASGTVCRAATGGCDVAETCDGSSFSCPADAVQPLGIVCRSSNGACDVAETCDGTTKACPADGFASTTTVCRTSTGTCDAAETCTGTSVNCPPDGFASASTVCRPAAGGCDVPETCTGTSAICPPDVIAGAGIVCRAAVSLCDVAETCSGSTAACPGDAFAPAGTTCGSGIPAPVCSGSNGACPVASSTSDVLGFEASADWAFDPSATASIVGLSPNRTQGASSLEVTAQGAARLNSAAVSSIGGSGAMILVDIQLPANQANPSSFGDAQMFINSPSLGINNLSLGDISLNGLALGKWQTLAFQLPAGTASSLANGMYSDLTFSIVLNVASNETGHYLLDNIRTSADVVPSLLGVAQDGTKLKAVFDYLTTSSTPVSIPYGTANGLANQSGFIASPPELPPLVFVPSQHAPFVATLSGSLLTWTVGGHTATATPSSPHLPVTTLGDGTHDATLPDGRKVNLDSVPPPDVAKAPGPPVGDPFNGVLTGQFSVSTSGAATYSVPIFIPPGISGMAPNLSLAYSSQSSDGILGQGWSLGGLSMISRCPRTRQQDGYGRPVMLDSLTPSNNPDGQSDGICLDGKKLFESTTTPGSYTAEIQDFSTITRVGTQFQVVTKAGETRYYGRLNAANVSGAIWLLDRVIDPWGNFFDIHYNNDQGNGSPSFPNSFTASGIWVSRIDYTGTATNSSCNVALPPASCFFATITFEYECRADIRWTRLGSLRIPQSQRLKSITTPRGKYAFTYTQNSTQIQGQACAVGEGPTGLGASQLSSIGYCAGSQCMTPLSFGWQGGGGSWDSNAGYVLPPSIVGTSKGLQGTQFVDINGDGRADFVLARTNGINGQGSQQVATLLNTGSGWGPQLAGTGQIFPLYLSDASDKATGVRFADLDGDGRLDVFADSANVACDSNNICLSCPVGQPTCGANTQHYGPAVWLNRFTVDGGGGWQFAPDYSGASVTFTGDNPTMVADVDGDGKADFIRVTQVTPNPQQQPGAPFTTTVTVLINSTVQGVHTWTQQQKVYQNIQSLEAHGLGQNPTPFQLADVNRDGLVDLIHDDFFRYSDQSVQSTEVVLINQGPDANDNHNFRFGSPIPHTAPGGGSLIDIKQFPPHLADVDGDGFHDVVAYAGTTSQSSGFYAALGFGDGTGSGFGSDSGQGLYLNVLRVFSPLLGSDIDSAQTQDYATAFVDIDGDGLVDVVRNHWNRLAGSSEPGVGGGEILLNTGRTWLSVSGHTGWELAAGAIGVKIPASIPGPETGQAGNAFVDLDGDGMPDIIQEEEADTNLPPGAWINPYQRPYIKTFPNGLATPTTVNYVETTSLAGASTYKDDDPVETNTKAFPVPLTVVASVIDEDGSGTGPLSTKTSTYTYHSVRQDSFGRGPLGFHRLEVFDSASKIRTVTTYAQAYPYTGMPTEVDKYQVVGSASHLTNKTTTTYCNQPLGCGPVPVGPIAPGTVMSTLPNTVTDVAYLHPEVDDLTNNTTITTSFQFDAIANPIITGVTMVKTEGGTTETFGKQVQNFYDDTAAAAEGKPTKTITTATGGTATRTHTKTFDYAAVSTFGGVSSKVALIKERVEPDADWPVRLDTAYQYDQFGNLKITTACASDFDGCTPGATNPFGSGDPMHHPPYRTTTVSYDPAVLGTPVSYGVGRFPVVVTNAAGHTEKTLYDPLLGKILNKTGPNGIQVCYAYDPIGRLTSETDRCGSSAPLVTTTQYFVTLPRHPICLDPGCVPPPPNFSPPNSVIVTVTTRPDGTPGWSYSDDQGKSTGTLNYAFDGGFIETTTAYNAVGQITLLAKPIHIATVDDQVTQVYTITAYDDFNRLKTVTDPLGVIDASGVSKSTTITNTYDGSTLQATRTVNGQVQTRLETKNAMGKVASVTTQTETGPSTISYSYDADGNLTITKDPAANEVQIGYDTRGRKSSTIDPDMGTWGYTEDGFGDLVSQTDAKLQSTVMTYDPLGRMLTKTDATGTAQWVYDTAPGAGVGKLAAMVSPPDPNLAGPCTIPLVTITGGNRAGKSWRYTALGEVQEVDECADATTFASTYQYDALGRQSLVRYPIVGSSQLAVGYHYTSLGYLQYLTDDSSDYSVLWQAKAMNALGQVTDEQMRNGVETASTRNPLTGWLLGSTATAHSDQDRQIQNWSYGFDEIGNLLTRNRADAVNAVTSSETFTYDLTNRLSTSLVTTSGGGNQPDSFGYDALGNLMQKGGNVYTYGAGCQAGARGAGPHAVCTVAGGAPFVYDANGNLTASGSRSVTYNPSNKVTHVESDPATSQGNDTGSVYFMYGADGNRVVQSVTSGNTNERTIYVGLGSTGKSLYELTTKTGAPTTHVHFIYANVVHGGNAFALRVLDDGGAVVANRYYSSDHLGSVTAMSDDQGHVSATGTDPTAFGYDPWGARRNPDGTAANPASFDLPFGHREFTAQEQVPNVGLVNMNGRLYDPSLGRFLSPDPNIQFVSDLQSYNRYSYAGNNPLRYTDPTGFFWSEIGGFFKKYFSNPITDIEFVAAVAVCAVSEGAECYTLGLVIAAMNVGIAVANGASFDQTIVNAGIGLGIGLITGGIGQELGMSVWQGMLVGAASAALTTGISNALAGRSFFEYNMLGAAMISAAQGAATLGLQRAVSVSLASAVTAEGGGGGSGESHVESRSGALGALDDSAGGSAVAEVLDPNEGGLPDDIGGSGDPNQVAQTGDKLQLNLGCRIGGKCFATVGTDAGGKDVAAGLDTSGQPVGGYGQRTYLRDELHLTPPVERTWPTLSPVKLPEGDNGFIQAFPTPPIETPLQVPPVQLPPIVLTPPVPAASPLGIPSLQLQPAFRF